MKVELSFDDGHRLDVQVIKILDALNLKATFYIPIGSWGYDNPDEYEGHVVGGHTVTQPNDLKLLSDEELQREIDTKALLHAQFFSVSDSFCPPRGRYDDRVIQVVKKCGFTSLRTTRVLSYYDTHSFLKDTAFHFYPRAEYEGKALQEVFHAMLNTYKNDDNAILRIWGHSWELEKLSLWDEFNQCMEEIAKLTSTSK